MITARREPLPGPPLRLESRFGALEADPRDIVSFPEGLPGFESAREFVVLSSPDFAPLQCLHAVPGGTPSFLGIDPRLAFPGYRCLLGDRDRLRLGVREEAGLLWLAIVTIASTGSATVNLRAPVVLNPARMIGFQVVPHDALYPLRHALSL
jgi:flagellar assembly factor FliW